MLEIMTCWWTLFVFINLKFATELLRLCRRFSLKELLMDDSLQYLSLKILSLALSANPRGQNHFKSIGGLEVLLDGLGFPSNYATTYTKFVLTNGFRYYYMYFKPIILCLIHSSQSRGIPAGSRCLGAARRPTATGRVGAEQLGFAAAPGGFSVDWCGACRGSPSRVRNAFLFSWVLRVFLKFYWF
jgi:hypothetical protein